MIDSNALTPFLHTTLGETSFDFLGERYKGKVRDVYMPDDARRILIATDRQSAFDIAWCEIPLKGQVLNQISAWWFDRIRDVMPVHMISVPDPNVAVVQNLRMFKVEIIVRAYLTGSTETSAWVNYKNGVRNFCGNVLPEGMVKNQKFDEPIITPTTKGEIDELIDAKGIIERKLTTPEQWLEIEQKALAVFRRGQQIAAERGLILVDTKYEMGINNEGEIVIADEVHTPDSSRYWVAKSYEERFANKQEPESLDKEFFRLWLKEQGFDPARPNETRPEVTDEARIALAQKYIGLYEKMTGEIFQVPTDPDVPGRIEKNLRALKA